MSRTIIYDCVRLFLGSWVQAPRGVDRIELLYARYLFEHWPGDCLGLLATPWGTRIYDRSRALRLLQAIESLWRETSDPQADERLRHTIRRLAGEAAPTPRARHGGAGPIVRQVELLRTTGWTFGRSAIEHAAQDGIYLNVGQLGWAAPWTSRWLRQRRDIRAVYMLHDVIPLLHPDLVSGGGRLSQRWMLATVARHAAGLITTTDVAADAVMRALQPLIKRVVPTKAIHLPVAPVFINKPIPEDILSGVPYFVVCGAIEPRKNHRLLFRVWRRLVAERGAGAPRLLVVGTPAHKGEAILAELANGEFPRSHILSVRGLSSPGVRRLMASARALLMPSFAEGFGLPIVEALSVGTPVMASDLPAHREVGGELACYLDPADEAAWLEAVRAILDAPAHVADLRRRIEGYRPLTSAGYFSRVGAFFEAIP